VNTKLRYFALIGMLEYWNFGMMGTVEEKILCMILSAFDP
jgi:hypothetical protein